MIILGDISGIQNYLFDIAAAGGGQARRLRARSFFIQILAECAALRVLRRFGWPIDESHFLLSGAGKFLLRGPSVAGIGERLHHERQHLNDWLLRETRGELRLMLTWVEDATAEGDSYRQAQRSLQFLSGGETELKYLTVYTRIR